MSDITTPMQDLLNQIAAGTFDSKLENLHLAILQRKATLRPAFGFQVGPKVRFNRGISPQYMCGRTATIVKVNGTTCSVELMETAGRFRAGHPIRCHKDLLDVVV